MAERRRHVFSPALLATLSVSMASIKSLEDGRGFPMAIGFLFWSVVTVEWAFLALWRRAALTSLAWSLVPFGAAVVGVGMVLQLGPGRVHGRSAHRGTEEE